MDNSTLLPVPAGGTLGQTAAHLIDAMADGTISLEAAAALIKALATIIKAREVDDVHVRLENLEAGRHL